MQSQIQRFSLQITVSKSLPSTDRKNWWKVKTLKETGWPRTKKAKIIWIQMSIFTTNSIATNRDFSPPRMASHLTSKRKTIRIRFRNQSGDIIQDKHFHRVSQGTKSIEWEMLPQPTILVLMWNQKQSPTARKVRAWKTLADWCRLILNIKRKCILSTTFDHHTLLCNCRPNLQSGLIWFQLKLWSHLALRPLTTTTTLLMTQGSSTTSTMLQKWTE